MSSPLKLLLRFFLTFFFSLNGFLVAQTLSGRQVALAAPTITSFNPTSGPVGLTVVITGTEFTGATSVRFNGTSASFTVNSATQITTIVPTGATSGPLTVVTPTGTVTTTDRFTIGPGITGFSPTSGVVGATVQIQGTNLTGTAAVTFNSTAATSFTVNGPGTLITAIVPLGATTGPISVGTPRGTATTTTSFTVGPTLSSFSPTSGPVGSEIILTGLNFTGTTTVTFNGIAAAFTINTPTQITATVPITANTGTIAVTTPVATATSSTSFAVTAPPTLTSFSPTTGAVGTSVIISGSNFTGASSVTFNGLAATFTVNSSAQIAATVPGGASSGPIRVTLPGGVNVTSATSFTVIPPPTITTLDPNSGVVGTSVLLTGTHFTDASSVTFNGVAATFTVNSATQLTTTVPAGATTGLLTVTTPGGTASSSFTVFLPPTLDSFSPTSGPVGTTVILTGTNFTGATSLTFNGTAATFTVNTVTQITSTVPAGATTGLIAVATPGGSAISTTNFTVILPPTITSFSPNLGLVGTSVVITGSNFTAVTAVRFNGRTASFSITSDTQITATVATGTTTGTVSVTSPGGTATSTTNFTVVFPPTLTSFNPTSGPVGTSSTLTGTNFTEATSVTFNGTAATFTVNSATQITTTVPAGATTGLIAVTTPGGTATNPTPFTVFQPPTITGFSPTGGTVGTSVLLTGTNLIGTTAVRFNGLSATFTLASSTQVVATVPSGATTGPISVTTPGGTASSLDSFTVAPTISSFSPSSGSVGTPVTIVGLNFTGATSLTFNSTPATFTVDSPTQITATVPSGASTGALMVTTAGGTSTSATNFTVAPSLTSFTPTNGPVGTTVILTGTNFTGATSVTFNGLAATFTVNSSAQIIATVPTGATTGVIGVIAPGGTSSSTTPFIVLQTPTISGFSPTSGPVNTTVILTGTNFTGTTSLTFNGTVATFTVDSATQITTTVPGGSISGPLTVANPAGSATSATHFEVIPPPKVTAINPSSGVVGISVIINGNNFLGATVVRFNGVPATTFSINAAAQITAIVPDAATSGPVSVTTPGGTGTSLAQFTVLTAPIITSFSPTGGFVGDTVVITGSFFSGATSVTFKGTPALFKVNSATKITTVIPTGATTGPITITTSAGPGTSTQNFIVFNPPTLTSFSPPAAGVGSSVVLTGTNLSGSTSVTFNGTAATFTVDSDTQITATVPSGATTGVIVVTNPAGSATSSTAFNVVPAPTITSFSPTSGPVGTVVTVRGTNFRSVTAVLFNGVSAVTVNAVSNQRLEATVPPGATTGTITVTTLGGTVISGPSFTVTGPVLTSFSPLRGNFGTTVILTGTNLAGASAVTFNGLSAAFTVNSTTQIAATVPPGAVSGPIQITTGQGSGSSPTRFTVNPAALRTEGWQQAGTADFNQDGNPDLLWRNYTTGVNRVWFMNGGAYIGEADFVPVSDPTWQLIGSADFTNDGKPDLLWRNFSSGQNSVWQMNGTQYVTSFDIGPVTDPNWQLAAIGDLTNDQRPDLIWRNYGTGEVYAWQMDGYTYQQAFFVGNVADPYWQLAGTGDLTNDGKPDLLWRYWGPGAGSGDVYLWQMDGYTYQTFAFIATVPDLNYQLTGNSDFTGDGQRDLVWSNNFNGDNYLWRMDGYTFQEAIFLGPKP